MRHSLDGYILLGLVILWWIVTLIDIYTVVAKKKQDE